MDTSFIENKIVESNIGVCIESPRITPAHPLILTTLEILNTRYISADSDQDKKIPEIYKKRLEEHAYNISQEYAQRDENDFLFYNGFIHEACFFIACQKCFPEKFSIRESTASQDIKGIDFILSPRDNLNITKAFDVTISPEMYASRLGSEYIGAITILLPTKDPKTGLPYVELFLRRTSPRFYRSYFGNVIDYNRKILTNQKQPYFNINLTSGKNRNGNCESFRNNGTIMHEIEFSNIKFKKIMSLLDTLEECINS